MKTMGRKLGPSIHYVVRSSDFHFLAKIMPNLLLTPRTEDRKNKVMIFWSKSFRHNPFSIFGKIDLILRKKFFLKNLIEKKFLGFLAKTPGPIIAILDLFGIYVGPTK